MGQKASQPLSRRRIGMQLESMSVLHDSTIGEEGNGPAPPPLTSTPSPSNISSSSTRLPWRNAGYYLRNRGPWERTAGKARLYKSPNEIRLRPQHETPKQVLHLVQGYDVRVAIIVRVPGFGKTQEVMLMNLTTVTYDKLKRSIEEVFLIDETYQRGGNVHIADRDTVEEVERIYLRRCTGETSKVIEVHEGNVKAVIKLLGAPTGFGELCVEFAQSLGVNARRAENIKVTSNEKGTEKERDERTLSQTTEAGEITSERGAGCSVCGSLQSHQPVARPFPNDTWDK